MYAKKDRSVFVEWMDNRWMTRWMDILPVVKKRGIKLPQALAVNLFQDVFTLISHTYIITPFTG